MYLKNFDVTHLFHTSNWQRGCYLLAFYNLQFYHKLSTFVIMCSTFIDKYMKEFAITKQLAYHVWPFIQLKTLFPILPPTFLTVHFFDWIKCLSKHLCWYSHFMYKLRCYRYFDCKYRNCIFFQSWKYDCIYCNGALQTKVQLQKGIWSHKIFL